MAMPDNDTGLRDLDAGRQRPDHTQLPGLSEILRTLCGLQLPKRRLTSGSWSDLHVEAELDHAPLVCHGPLQAPGRIGRRQRSAASAFNR
jgi:hypothetical protein